MSKSILLDGTERRLFEQQVPAGLGLDMSKDAKGDYANPQTHGIYLGFLIGQVTGISQGVRIAKVDFEKAYATAAAEAIFSQSEVGTSAGLGAIDQAIEKSDTDRSAVAHSPAGLQDTLMTQHGEMLRTMALENYLSSVEPLSKAS